MIGSFDIGSFLQQYGIIILVVILSFFTLIVYSFKSFTSVKQARRLDRVTGDKFKQVVTERDPLLVAEDAGVESFLSKILPSFKATQRRMSRAGIKITTKMYLVAIIFLAGLVSIFYPTTFLPQYSQPLVYAIAIHFFTDIFILRVLRWRYRKKILKQLPEALDYIIRGLLVGQSLDTVIREASDNIDAPLGDELKMIPRLSEIGLSLSESLDISGSEVDLSEYDFFVAACKVQLESGGNLAEVLMGLTNMLRNRKSLQDKIAGLSAEGKMTAGLLSMLPIGLFAYLYFSQPEYLEPMFTTDLGNVILWAIFIFIFLGAGIAAWLARVKI